MTIILEDGIHVVLHHHMSRFNKRMGVSMMHQVDLFCCFVLNLNIDIFLTRIMDDSKKVVIWLNIRDYN